jgi:copper chaperone CopZ
MKKLYIKGICCKGCERELTKIFVNIYGVKNVKVSQDDCTVSYDGYVSERVIRQALKDTDYEIDRFDIES